MKEECDKGGAGLALQAAGCVPGLSDGIATTGRGSWGTFLMEGGSALLSHCREHAQVSPGMGAQTILG